MSAVIKRSRRAKKSRRQNPSLEGRRDFMDRVYVRKSVCVACAWLAYCMYDERRMSVSCTR